MYSHIRVNDCESHLYSTASLSTYTYVLEKKTYQQTNKIIRRCNGQYFTQRQHLTIYTVNGEQVMKNLKKVTLSSQVPSPNNDLLLKEPFSGYRSPSTKKIPSGVCRNRCWIEFQLHRVSTVVLSSRSKVLLLGEDNMGTVVPRWILSVMGAASSSPQAAS